MALNLCETRPLTRADKGEEANRGSSMQQQNERMRWEQVQAGDFIIHPWPRYRIGKGTLIEVLAIRCENDVVVFSTIHGIDQRRVGSVLIEVVRPQAL